MQYNLCLRGVKSSFYFEIKLCLKRLCQKIFLKMPSFLVYLNHLASCIIFVGNKLVYTQMLLLSVLCFSRWDKEKPASVSNLVLLKFKEVSVRSLNQFGIGLMHIFSYICPYWNSSLLLFFLNEYQIESCLKAQLMMKIQKYQPLT